MHPAYSVIFFTASSGAGYGLLFLLAILGALGLLPAERWFGLAGFAIALGLISGGLLSSTFHLGHPERSWRAFSQWRSSWLSREGVLAVFTYVPSGLLAIGWIYFETTSSVWSLMAWLTAFFSVATVYSTAMIYASLKTIPQWHNGLVPPVFLFLALATGAVLLNFLMLAFGIWQAWAAVIAIAALLAALALKLRYWAFLNTRSREHTVESATGLKQFGNVRPLDPPHTAPNYLNKEMGYAIARRHSERLRRHVLTLCFITPALLLALILVLPGMFGLFAAGAAVIASATGVVIERWLLFADAEHVVNLYYGREAI